MAKKYKKSTNIDLTKWSNLSNDLIDKLKHLESLLFDFEYNSLLKFTYPFNGWYLAQFGYNLTFEQQLDEILGSQRKAIYQAIKSLNLDISTKANKELETITNEKPNLKPKVENYIDLMMITNNAISNLRTKAIGVRNEMLQDVWGKIKARDGKFKTKNGYAWTMEETLKNFYEVINEAYDKGLANMKKVTYSNGREVSFDNYVEMAIRTTVNNTAMDMLTEVGAKLGLLFYLASSLPDSAPDHAPYQGKPYILDEWEEKIKDECKKEEIKKWVIANDIKGIKWVTKKGTWKAKSGKEYAIGLCTRPNCRHTLTPITFDQAKNYKETLNDLGLNVGNYQAKNYNDLQQQRALERKLRALKQELKQNKTLLEDATKNEATNLMAQFNTKIKTLNKSISDTNKDLRTLLANNKTLSRDRRRESPGFRVDVGVGYNRKMERKTNE